ncbi:MAG TPA: rod shape-determining protein MreC [Candidatus Saccharimonadales bacterium]|nr:rod shape-determining protein MreC [Candidatus Saccharimonadales bacterium]
MQKRKSFFPTFLIFFIPAIILFVLAGTGYLNGLTGFFETGTVPIQKSLFGIFHPDSKDELSKLQDENRNLASQLTKQEEMKRDNQALRDQFQTGNPAPNTLLPATVIGGEDDTIIIDKGQADMIQVGDVVVLKDNLIGKVDRVSMHLAVVDLITGNTSFTAKTVKTDSLGIVKGQSGGLLLSNVVLSDKLEKGDLVVAKGDVDSHGIGFPPDLIAGKIVSVNKKASNLFQSAEVRSLVDFAKLKIVFVITQ